MINVMEKAALALLIITGLFAIIAFPLCYHEWKGVLLGLFALGFAFYHIKNPVQTNAYEYHYDNEPKAEMSETNEHEGFEFFTSGSIVSVKTKVPRTGVEWFISDIKEKSYMIPEDGWYKLIENEDRTTEYVKE